MKAAGTAFDALEHFLKTEISAKRAELARDIKLDGVVSKENKNLFGRFVAASEREGSQRLDDREITGNLFVFMLAGVRTPVTVMVYEMKR